jgi:hypothetical protein
MTQPGAEAAASSGRAGQKSTIDLFFRSLAERLGDGFAVVLSGAGSDGASGVRAVKEAGGIARPLRSRVRLDAAKRHSNRRRRFCLAD